MAFMFLCSCKAALFRAAALIRALGTLGIHQSVELNVTKQKTGDQVECDNPCAAQQAIAGERHSALPLSSIVDCRHLNGGVRPHGA
jgi:hypothetical protein